MDGLEASKDVFRQGALLFQRTPRWLRITGAVLLALLLAAAAAVPFLGPWARGWVIEALREHYQSNIELSELRLGLLPRPHAEGAALVFRHRGRRDVPPLVIIRRFTAEASFFGLLRSPVRVRHLRLEGLLIHVPPKGGGQGNQEKQPGKGKGRRAPFVLEEIIADGTTLQTLPKQAGKQPLQFDIERLTLHSVGVDRPMTFEATLMNAKPPGRIQSHGSFGPWAADEPGRTPVSGHYTFRNANLAVFKGIAGILASDGEYRGALGRIEVDGRTDTPDFALRVSGHPVRLQTQFHAVVDGTNGDTVLEPVNARFLQTRILTRGGVTGTPGVKGKTVSLEATVTEARLEDLLRLAMKVDPPPLTGAIRFQSKIVIPPGERDVVEKLGLDGTFELDSARFTSLNIQQKVGLLSKRARGQTDSGEAGSVASQMRGRFVLGNGLLRLSRLTFAVPGAVVQLDGTYGLRGGELDFRGTVRLEAKLSETVTGFKSVLLRAIDPVFKRQGAGAVIPIRISGTREKPAFGLDVGRVMKRK